MDAPPAEDRPAHYRLGDETWALILKEYMEGATAPFLSKKWRVSEHAIRARITRHKATKRDWGDSQAVAQVLAREAELEEARRNSPEALARRLFDGLEDRLTGEIADPRELAQLATLASGRAMTGRLWAEAKALAGLAESYARLHAKAEAEVMTLDNMPLQLLAEAAACLEHPPYRLAFTHPDAMRKSNDPSDPDMQVRSWYWKRRQPWINRHSAEVRAAYERGRQAGLAQADPLGPPKGI